jgi:hypothetical protein
MKKAQSIALVTAPTRYQGLLQRWGTRGQAKFRLQQAIAHQAIQAGPARSAAAQAEADFDQYANEHAGYGQTLERLRDGLASFDLPVAIVERRYLPSFEFRNAAVVVVFGPDGLVANTAKYVGGLPIVGVNPDPRRIDGILLPFAVRDTERAVGAVLAGRAKLRPVTMAQATLNDGQRLLAFNDLFIGRRSHASARYNLTAAAKTEAQSSSGLIVATGAGSTGWLSSVFNMMHGVTAWRGGQPGKPLRLQWQERKLAWVVREPFASRHSAATLVAGQLAEGETLVLESLMPEGGAIFSDGIEDDFLEFNSGTTVTVTIAQQQAQLATR